MKFIYIFALTSLFRIALAQDQYLSSNIKLLPLSHIPNIYADAAPALTEMKVDEQIDLRLNANNAGKKTDIADTTSKSRLYQNKKIKSYPKL